MCMDGWRSADETFELLQCVVFSLRNVHCRDVEIASAVDAILQSIENDHDCCTQERQKMKYGKTQIIRSPSSLPTCWRGTWSAKNRGGAMSGQRRTTRSLSLSFSAHYPLDTRTLCARAHQSAGEERARGRGMTGIFGSLGASPSLTRSGDVDGEKCALEMHSNRKHYVVLAGNDAIQSSKSSLPFTYTYTHIYLVRGAREIVWNEEIIVRMYDSHALQRKWLRTTEILCVVTISLRAFSPPLSACAQFVLLCADDKRWREGGGKWRVQGSRCALSPSLWSARTFPNRVHSLQNV